MLFMRTEESAQCRSQSEAAIPKKHRQGWISSEEGHISGEVRGLLIFKGALKARPD